MQLLFHVSFFCMVAVYFIWNDPNPDPVESETVSKPIQIQKILISGLIGLQNPDPAHHSLRDHLWFDMQNITILCACVCALRTWREVRNFA